MTAYVTYSGVVHPMAESVIARTADGRCAIRVPFNSSLAVTYERTQDIDQQIRTLLAARDLLEREQDATDRWLPVNHANGSTS